MAKHKRSKVAKLYRKIAATKGSGGPAKKVLVKAFIHRRMDGGYYGWACVSGAGNTRKTRCSIEVAAPSPTKTVKKALTALAKGL